MTSQTAWSSGKKELQLALYNDPWFRSQHEDIDLISEDDFYLNAPESVSRPVSAGFCISSVYTCYCVCVS